MSESTCGVTSTRMAKDLMDDFVNKSTGPFVQQQQFDSLDTFAVMASAGCTCDLNASDN